MFRAGRAGRTVTVPHDEQRPVRAWDWPTRAFHWLLVVSILCAWISAEFAVKLGDRTLIWHRWNGYAILVLVVFRLIWGVAGSSTSQLAAMGRSVSGTFAYIQAMLAGRSQSYLGHNPLGIWMIMALLLAVMVQGVLGLYTMEHNQITEGPLVRTIGDDLAETLSRLHLKGFNIILALVAVHVLANSVYALWKKDPLVRAMVTGSKPVRPYVDAPEAVIAPQLALRVGLALLAAIIIVFGGITLADGRVL
jgi:cytochrome b